MRKVAVLMRKRYAQMVLTFQITYIFLDVSMKMLSIAVDEQLLIHVGKSTVLYKSYDANMESN